MNDRCPKCRGELTPRHLTSTQRCARCGGLWIAASEIDAVATGAAVLASLRKSRAALKAVGKPTAHACADCSAGLVAAAFQCIEIDLCPECLGVFLDKGELDRFLNRSPDLIPLSWSDSTQWVDVLDLVIELLVGVLEIIVDG